MNAEEGGSSPRIDCFFVRRLNAIPAVALLHPKPLRDGVNSSAVCAQAPAVLAINWESVANSTICQTDGTAMDWDVGESVVNYGSQPAPAGAGECQREPANSGECQREAMILLGSMDIATDHYALVSEPAAGRETLNLRGGTRKSSARSFAGPKRRQSRTNRTSRLLTSVSSKAARTCCSDVPTSFWCRANWVSFNDVASSWRMRSATGIQGLAECGTDASRGSRPNVDQPCNLAKSVTVEFGIR
jgi:hypothetical protein